MAIVEKTISDAIFSMQDELSEETNSEEARRKSADKWAKIIADAIKSADVIGVTTTVNTTGSAAAQTGTGTQNNKGNLE